MTTHYLKLWPSQFAEVISGTKTFEYRKNDRDFKLGDILVLQEYHPVDKKFTGREYTASVPYILYGGSFGVPDDYCIMSITPA